MLHIDCICTHHVLCEVCIKHMTCRAGIGQKPWASFTLQGDMSRDEQNGTDSAWKKNLRHDMEAFTDHAEPSRTEFCLSSLHTSSGILTAYSNLIAARCSRHVMSRRSCRAN